MLQRSLECKVIITEEVCKTARIDSNALARKQVTIHGRDETMTIRTAVDPTTLTTLLDTESTPAAAPATVAGRGRSLTASQPHESVTWLGFAFLFNERNSRLGAGVYVLLSAQEGALDCRKTIELGNAHEKRKNNIMMRTISTFIAVAIGVSAAIAQTDPIATRKSLMKKNDEHERNLRRMVRAEVPFDVAKVNEAFAQWGDTALHLAALFPDNSKTGQDTRAMSKIWETRSDFEAKIAAWAKAIADNKDKASTLDELKVAHASVKTTCDNCHESYRAPSQRQPAQKK